MSLVENQDSLGGASFERTIDRKSVRAYVAKESAELREVAEAGGNVYQASLDQQDRVHQMIAGFSDEEKAAFLTVYAEEVQASASQTGDEASRVLEQAARQEAANAQAAGVLGGMVFLGVIIFLFLRN